MIQCQIDIGKRLSFNSLRCIHNQNRTVTGCQTSGNLIIKVHMPRGINHIQNVLFPVSGLVDSSYCLGFDGNSPFPLKVHVVQNLILHLTFRKQSCLLNNPVCKRGFPMVNMCNNTKITYLTLIYCCQNNSSCYMSVYKGHCNIRR